MSKHHTLPPIIYTPPPKPKKIETRKRRIGVGMLDDVDETADARQTTGTGQSAPASPRQPPQNFAPIEGADRKPQHPRGRLSEGTLKAMLEVQELK
jgi:hypothetical protein